MDFILLAAAVLAVAVAVVYYVSRRRTGIWSVACDLRRSIVIIGPEQNHEDCVAQRRSLKPLLISVRQLGMNVVEVYGSAVPRRNGRPLEWLENRSLRRGLKAASGFHIVCLDDDAEVTLHGRRPVSQSVLAEFIAMEAPLALPAPTPNVEGGHGTPRALREDLPAPESPQTSWGSVSVLR